MCCAIIAWAFSAGDPTGSTVGQRSERPIRTVPGEIAFMGANWPKSSSALTTATFTSASRSASRTSRKLSRCDSMIRVLLSALMLGSLACSAGDRESSLPLPMDLPVVAESLLNHVRVSAENPEPALAPGWIA